MGQHVDLCGMWCGLGLPGYPGWRRVLLDGAAEVRPDLLTPTGAQPGTNSPGACLWCNGTAPERARFTL